MSCLHAYNATSSNWSPVPKCPVYRFAAIVINGLLTTIGGYTNNDKDTNKLFSLTGEGSGEKWTEEFPPMPTKRYSVATLCTGTVLIVVGGLEKNNELLKTVEVMNTETCQWSTAADLPELLKCVSLTVCGDHIYLLGGGDKDDNPMKSVYSCSLSALLFSCGSKSLGRRLVSTLSRSIEVSVWNRVADLPVTYSTCVSVHGQLLAIGGEDSDGQPTTAIHMYNPTTSSWEVISHMISPRCWCFAAVLPDNQLMVVGGWIGKDDCEIVDSVEFANVIK